MLASAKVGGVVEFCDQVGIDYFKQDISELSMFLIAKDKDSSTTAVLLADYRMILTSKNITAFSH